MRAALSYPDLRPLLEGFPPISLSGMDSVRLLNRVDRKYALHVSQLPALLSRLTAYYQILDMDGQRCFRYHTTYYDTPDLTLYLAHHNGLMNRIKIRCRQYADSGQCFFEIKQKQTGNRTHKLRYPIAQPFQEPDETACSAIAGQYQRRPLSDLSVSLYNSFSRITLVSQTLGERCTIDLNLTFRSPEGREATAADVAVVELKQSRVNPLSPVMQALRAERIFPCSFSKYIYGLIHTRPGLKHNAFKPLLHRLEKIRRMDFHDGWDHVAVQKNFPPANEPDAVPHTQPFSHPAAAAPTRPL